MSNRTWQPARSQAPLSTVDRRVQLSMRQFTMRCNLTVRPEDLWGELSIDTVNYELFPWIRMSAPRVWRNVKLMDWNNNGPLFSSWVLLLGVLPIDRHAFGSLDLSQSLRFVETSSSWINRIWRHERILKATPNGCEVTDKVSFSPRIPIASALLERIYLLVFAHRHSRLKEWNALATGQTSD